MGSHGIKDRVAIVGMGCTPFGEHWDKGADDLLIDAVERGVRGGRRRQGRRRRVLARHRAESGMSGMTLARPLQLEDKPVTRVENFCATGSEALRQAAYAVASRRVRHRDGDRRREGEGQRLPGPQRRPRSRTTAPAARSPRRRCSRMVAPAYAKKYGVDERRAEGGARPDRVEEPLQRRAQPAGAVPARDDAWSRSAPRRRWPGALGVFDCAGVADGSAAAIVVRAEDAHRYTDKPLYIKALSFVAGNGSGCTDPDYDYTHFPEVEASARGRVRAGRRHRPAPRARDGRGARLLHARPSSCSWRTSASPSGARRGRRCSRARSTSHGELPVNPDGGLKSFGHPVGASGLRMMFEAGSSSAARRPRSAGSPTTDRLALTHNLGGYPGEMVSFVSIVGSELG